MKNKAGQGYATTWHRLSKDEVKHPQAFALILTHIFLGLPVVRIDAVEAVKQSATASLSQGVHL